MSAWNRGLTVGRIKPEYAPWPRPPARCPVCGGRGTLPYDFYPDKGYTPRGERHKCRSCGGRGIA